MNYSDLEIGILILLAGIISIELGISTAMIEIIAGVIGSNVLNIHPSPWFDFIANFGLLGIMLFAGFETSPGILRRYAKGNLALGFVGYFFPFTTIFILTFFVLSFSISTSIVVSLSLSTTSLALVYAIIREHESSVTSVTHIMLGSAMIMDMLSMLTLSFLISEIRLDILLYSAVLIIIFLATFKLTPYIMNRYRGKMAELEVRFILVLLFVMLFFAEKLLVSEAVLAYLIGVILSEIVHEHEELIEKLRGIVFGFFAPAFFFKAGLLINLSRLTFDLLIYIALFGSLAYITKYFGTCLLARKFMSLEEARLMGLMFNFRLSFGIAAALIGYSIGILTIGLYTVIVMIVLLTSIVSSIILRIVPYELGATEY
ncbi:MAG: cation:proton antiporter [Candidatus Njordarchaeia archaeon]